MEDALCDHAGGTMNFKVATSSSENFCTTGVNSDGTQNVNIHRITDSRLY